MAVRFHRTATIAAGQIGPATVFATEVAEYASKIWPGTVTAYVEAFGRLGQIHWFADAEDIATVEKANNELNADEGYLALLAKAADLFIEGSGHDTLMTTL